MLSFLFLVEVFNLNEAVNYEEAAIAFCCVRPLCSVSNISLLQNLATLTIYISTAWCCANAYFLTIKSCTVCKGPTGLEQMILSEKGA